MEKERTFKCFKVERKMLPIGVVGDVLVEEDISIEGEKVKVPLLNIPMMSDEDWNRSAQENAIQNYINVVGKEPDSTEQAVEWQKKWIEEIMKS